MDVADNPCNVMEPTRTAPSVNNDIDAEYIRKSITYKGT